MTTESPETNQKSVPHKKDTAAAERFYIARRLVPLSRAVFCARHDISYHTMQSWELSRSISRTLNLTKFCQALAKEGVICTEDWLVDGIGPAAFRASSPNQINYYSVFTPRRLKKKPSNTFELAAHEEVAFFQVNCFKKGLEAVVVHVLDDAMYPDYEAGEFVGALKIDRDQADSFNQTICLVETEPHHFLIRQLVKEGETYLLLASNKAYSPLSLNSITSLGEIVWRRKSASERFDVAKAKL